MTNEIYKSSTLGPIPLSFTGRRLLANLREALESYVIEHRRSGGSPDWAPVSLARGKLAQYMSKLEGRALTIDVNAQELTTPPTWGSAECPCNICLTRRISARNEEAAKVIAEEARKAAVRADEKAVQEKRELNARVLAICRGSDLKRDAIRSFLAAIIPGELYRNVSTLKREDHERFGEFLDVLEGTR